jgi:hypothetical protein
MQPGLPWKKGRCGTMTHDYKRHATTTLFAGMNVADGGIISTFMHTHNHQDWIRFLKLIHNRRPPKRSFPGRGSARAEVAGSFPWGAMGHARASRISRAEQASSWQGNGMEVRPPRPSASHPIRPLV